MIRRENVLNRWWIIAGALSIHMCLGALYSWSVFTPKLIDPSGPYAFSAQQTQGVFSLGIMCVAIMAIVSGRLQERISPRALAVIGGLLLGLGYILGGLLGKTFFWQMVFIGFMGGSGSGMAYVIPLAVGIKWFPDKKGLVTGLVVAGYGSGAIIWVKSAGSWFNLLDKLDFFSLGGVQSVFILYGIIYLTFVLLGSLSMVNPPHGWLPKGFTPPKSTDENLFEEGSIAFESSEMMKTPQFYMVFLTFFLSSMAGMMVIGCIKLFGIDILSAKGFDPVAASYIAGTAMAWYAVFNGLGRILWGSFSDRIGRRLSLIVLCLFQSIIMFLFFKLGGTHAGLVVSACIIGFNYGGIYALFPAITADYFGNTTVGKNYGWVFLASGLSGIAGPQIAGYFKDAAAASGSGIDAWATSFMIASAGCLIATILVLFNRPPSSRKNLVA